MDNSKRRMKMSGSGTMDYECKGTVYAKRYHGEFGIDALQSKAETGLWYSGIQGNPFAMEGSGSTPQVAISDSIARTNERIKKLQQAVATMQESLKHDWPVD